MSACGDRDIAIIYRILYIIIDIMYIIDITPYEREDFMTQYIIDFPNELHREAKVRAAQEGVTLKDLILKAVKQYLKKKGVK